MRTHTASFLALAIAAQALAAQQQPRSREIVALPVLNFSSDEGFGYGALLEVYDYGTGAVRPYRYTLQPTVLFTSKGRRDATLFFDAPGLVRGWRWDAFVGREQELAAPYYGIGNSATYDKAFAEGANPYWYRYGRERVRVMGNVQRRLGATPLRLLVGAAYAKVRTDATPFDSGATLFASDFPRAPRGELFSGRAGLVMDTRDREIGPRTGWWNEVLVQYAREWPATTFTRVTATARRYTPVTQRLTLASRVLAQQASGDVPVYDLATVQSSYKSDEGLGGAKMLRGIPKNRVMGKGVVLLNNELRWRATDFRLRGKSAFLGLSGFVDAGRVWSESIRLDQMASHLWIGYGGGVRLGLGESSVIAVDVGRSSNATQLYIGLGYAF